MVYVERYKYHIPQETEINSFNKLKSECKLGIINNIIDQIIEQLKLNVNSTQNIDVNSIATKCTDYFISPKYIYTKSAKFN